MSSILEQLVYDFVSSAEFLVKKKFPFFFLCGEFGKFILLHNFLWYIFISSSVYLVFGFHVSKAHSIFHHISDQRCVYVFTLKKHRSLFSDRV